MSNKELYNIRGGINLTAAFLSSIIRCITTITDLGKSVGTAIRRIRSGSMCSL